MRMRMRDGRRTSNGFERCFWWNRVVQNGMTALVNGRTMIYSIIYLSILLVHKMSSRIFESVISTSSTLNLLETKSHIRTQKRINALHAQASRSISNRILISCPLDTFYRRRASCHTTRSPFARNQSYHFYFTAWSSVAEINCVLVKMCRRPSNIQIHTD